MEIKRTIKLVGTIDEVEATIRVHDDYGIVLTKRQLKELIEKQMPLNTALWHDIVDPDLIGKGEEQGGGEVSIDSSTAENIVDAICQKLMKRDWPCGTDFETWTKARQTEFWKNFHKCLIDSQYRLTPNWLEERLDTVM